MQPEVTITNVGVEIRTFYSDGRTDGIIVVLDDNILELIRQLQAHADTLA